MRAPAHDIQYRDKRGLVIGTISRQGMLYLGHSHSEKDAPLPSGLVTLDDVDYEAICFEVTKRYHFPLLDPLDVPRVAAILRERHGFVFESVRA